MLIKQYLVKLSEELEGNSSPAIKKLMEDADFTDEQMEVIVKFESDCIRRGMQSMLGLIKEVA